MRLLITVFLFSLVSPAYAQLAVPNDTGIAFGHVHLKVSDPELHTKLWVDHFGGVVSEQSGLADRGLTAINLPNFFIILERGAPTGGTAGSVMDHIGFKVRNLADFLANWRAAGYSVDREFVGSEGVPNGYVTMPDGVWVELQEDPGLHVPIAGYHIHFWTPDYVELLDWYTEVFDLNIRPRGRIQTTTDVPGMNMSFGDAEGPTAPTRGRALDHIGFEVDDLEAFCQKLEAKGIEFDITYREVDSVELKIAFLTDPSGTYIELTEGYDEY